MHLCLLFVARASCCEAKRQAPPIWTRRFGPLGTYRSRLSTGKSSASLDEMVPARARFSASYPTSLSRLRAMLGMRRAEILRKFDEIVSFAEIEKFIDTPVKHFSSGMYVRLAFAVAAHLEPEILIIDEVLAVGDAAFQKKCLGQMREVSRGGRTVFFVSHNMEVIENLCRRGIVLQDGQVAFSGEMKHAVDYYLHSIDGWRPGHGSHIIDLSNAAGRPARYRPLLQRLELYTDQGRPLKDGLPMGAGLKAYIHFKLEEPTSNFGACLAFDSLFGQRVFTAHSIFEPHSAWGERMG